jgi:hypothetical protein
MQDLTAKDARELRKATQRDFSFALLRAKPASFAVNFFSLSLIEIR